MNNGLFDFISQACVTLSATAAPSITAMGVHIVLSLATIMLVWFGVQEALASAHGGAGFSMGRFLNLFMLLTFAYAMVNYYDSAIPGLGFSIKGFIDGGTANLVSVIGADGATTMLNEIHNHALRRDFIFANILGMIAAPHLDHHHYLAKLAIDGYIPQPDDVIGEKRNRVRAEREFRKRLIHLNGAQNRYPNPRQCEDHPVERFAKVGAEAGRQSHLKARQGIDHQALGADLLYSVENRVHGLIHRQIKGAEIKDCEPAVFLRRF